MSFSPIPQPRSRFAVTAVVLELLLGVGALAGGLALVLGPRGEILPLPLSALDGSPFDTYLVPGLILFFVIGLGPLAAAGLAWARHPLAPAASVVVGVGLVAWIGVEVAIIGYTDNPPLQPIYLVLGVVIAAVGLGWVRQAGASGLSRRTSLR